MTTTACVLPLVFHKVYMYAVFAKTVVLCSIIGFVHTVVVLPFLLSITEAFVPSRQPLPRKRQPVNLRSFGGNPAEVDLLSRTPANSELISGDPNNSDLQSREAQAIEMHEFPKDDLNLHETVRSMPVISI
ncbi:unnamed protein product [Gongylonema pulchrum]|uniref:SSD domain-containing protein n=1 Tax=Gongylonema pulchrum TaxID=637853 RepID=A0A183DR41_9BILA|nr:unnamed protein product [Gongylonema pulchrum]